MIGRQLGHYRVLDELGHGGMGYVYVAEDTTLARRVALKVLRPEVAASPARRARFQREARAAAALNHPNVVHLYSVEESEGELFITMELVPGKSLREILNDVRLLPIPRALKFATQIAEGLACAHAAGILHRDLKPGNVMVTGDDRVKILDFGLAKILSPASLSDLETTIARDDSTQGMTFGTAGYMSPEQALGKPLDSRTDLFALGVVLFEMTTGRAPFEGTTLAAVLDQLLHGRPPAPQTLNPAVPAYLAAVIDKCLEKERDRRYGTAIELLDDLTRVDPSSTRPAMSSRDSAEVRMPSSIVVLPFADMSPAKDQEYFCHGLTEEIINTLTRVPGLRVISRTSAFAFQGHDLEITEIGRRLRVGTALEGSVRKAGDRVRVTTQLVNAEDGYQIWSKRFDRELADVFAIQDEIAATIVSELQNGLVGAPSRHQSTFDPRAHDAYLQGIYARNKWTDGSMKRAMADFRAAIAQDAGFAPAYAALAEANIWMYSGIGILSAAEAVPDARRAIEKALELNPHLVDAHKARGLLAMNHDWDRAGAEAGLTRALELAPGSATAHLWNAWRLALLERRHDQALLELDEAERLDPLDLQLKTQLGYVHYFRHDLDRALQHFEKVVALEPSFAFAHYALGDVCTQRGQFERAIDEFDKAIALGGRSANHVGVLGYAHGLSGNRDQARALLNELTARAEESYVPAMWIALILLGLSDRDGVFQWLDRALDERDGSLILVTSAVEFDPLREDPRFKALLGRMGLGYLA